MFALDLFNNDHERRLAEGAVDQLEQRRIDDLAMKMDDLVARAKTATTPEAKAALVKEFQKCKAERDGYFKVRESGIPGNVPAEKIPGKEDLLKGRGRTYYEESDAQDRLDLHHRIDISTQDQKDHEAAMRAREFERNQARIRQQQGNLAAGVDIERWLKPYQLLLKNNFEPVKTKDRFEYLMQVALKLKGTNAGFSGNTGMSHAAKIFGLQFDEQKLVANLIRNAPKIRDLEDSMHSNVSEAGSVQAKTDDALRAHWEKLKREKQAGVQRSVPTEKIPGKENLLKGKGRSYYESQKKNTKQVAEVADPKDPTGQIAIHDQGMALPITSQYAGDGQFKVTIKNKPCIVTVAGFEIDDNRPGILDSFYLTDVATGKTEHITGGWNDPVAVAIFNNLETNQKPALKEIYKQDIELGRQTDWEERPERLQGLKLSGYNAIPADRFIKARDDMKKVTGQDLDEKKLGQLRPKLGSTRDIGKSVKKFRTQRGLDESQQLHPGDPVVVTAPNEFEGKTGEIYELSPSGKFVIVDLYNHGKHSMHLSDIEYNQYADQEEDDWYDEGLDEGAMSELDIMRQDLERMNERQFFTAYGISKQAFQQKYRTLLNPAPQQDTPVDEGWSDAIVAQRTGQPRTPYSVYIKGKKWKDFENDDHAEAVANKLRAKFQAEGRDPSVITIAPTDYDKDLKEAGSPAQQAAIAIAKKKQVSEFAPGNGGDDNNDVDPRLVKMAHDAGVVKGYSLADAATLTRAMAIDEWDTYNNGIYKQYFANGFKKGRLEKIRHGNEQYNLNLKLMKDGSVRHGEQGVEEVAPPGARAERMVKHIKKSLSKDGHLSGKDKAIAYATTWKAHNAGKVEEGVMSNVHAAMADVYHRLAPKIERHRDSFLAGQLYDELENIAELHGIEPEFKRMMAGARNRAHMDYDTNPGGFQNWFWYLPFADDEEELAEEQDTSGVESAIIRRIMVAHTDLLKQFGPQKVMQAAEEVAYNVGNVDEIGTSDVSAYVNQVRQILGATDEEQVNEKWSQKYKSSINCANPKGFSQRAHCASKKK